MALIVAKFGGTSVASPERIKNVAKRLVGMRQRGDEVVAFGRQGGNAITAAELAEQIGTIPYEVTCLISKRVPRVYLRGGRAVEVVNHIL